MRKHLITAAIVTASWLPGSAEYTTNDSFATYSLDDLCAIEESGVVKVDGFYAITSDLTIAFSDTLLVAEPADIRIVGEASLSIMGYIGLGASDTIRVSNYEEGSYPRSILIDGGRGVFDKVAFSGVGIHSWSEQPLTVTGCSFTGVTAASNSTGAIALGMSNAGNEIRDCVFTANAVPAIGTAANAFCGMGIYGCVFNDNNTDNSNKPQINITTPAENGPTVISGNIINGARRNMVGGIAVANMLGGELGDVDISGNTIRDNRYGINIYGPMRAVVKGNTLVDNRYEANPMNGGSAISCTAFDGSESVVISGNHIEGSLWGVTLISFGFLYPGYNYAGFGLVSLGEPANTAIDSPGDNVFVANGNDGRTYDPLTPYDIYNNTDQTVYAQNNTWSVPEQTEELVAEVVYDKADDSRLGEVIFMPTHAGVGSVTADAVVLSYDAASRTIVSDGEVQIFTADGRKVLSGHGMISASSLAPGIYIAVSPSSSLKFAVSR